MFGMASSLREYWENVFQNYSFAFHPMPDLSILIELTNATTSCIGRNLLANPEIICEVAPNAWPEFCSR